MPSIRQRFHLSPCSDFRSHFSIFEKQGGAAARIYTDYFSGDSDRVVWEFDVDSLGQLESFFQTASQNAEYQKAYEDWFRTLVPLIEGATVELWNREV